MGSYCSPDLVYREMCCPDASDVCTSGDTQCCAAGDACGTNNPVYYNLVDPTSNVPNLLPKFCVDSSRRVCCPAAQGAIDGICCEQVGSNCDGSCCLGSCSPTGQWVPNPTTAQCMAMGYMGTCDDVPGYREAGPNICEINGCCQNIPK